MMALLKTTRNHQFDHKDVIKALGLTTEERIIAVTVKPDLIFVETAEGSMPVKERRTPMGYSK